jgi:hypothetical protein
MESGAWTMPDFPKLPIITPPNNSFPELPIITPDPPRLTLQEKYGSLYYLGIAGLIITLLLVGIFSVSLWLTRDYWSAIVALNTPKRTEAEKIKAAWIIAHHPAANDIHRVEYSLRTDLPRLARYVLAESLTSDAIRADPKGYALTVAKSEGWPDWLRLLLTRPMAYGAGEGYRIAWEPLDLLRESKDPAIALWATYARAVMATGDPSALHSLSEAAAKKGEFQGLATILLVAARSEGDARHKKLDEATAWLRSHYPEATKIWVGWEERDGKLVEIPVSGKAEAVTPGA